MAPYLCQKLREISHRHELQPHATFGCFASHLRENECPRSPFGILCVVSTANSRRLFCMRSHFLFRSTSQKRRNLPFSDNSLEKIKNLSCGAVLLSSTNTPCSQWQTQNIYGVLQTYLEKEPTKNKVLIKKQGELLFSIVDPTRLVVPSKLVKKAKEKISSALHDSRYSR